MQVVIEIPEKYYNAIKAIPGEQCTADMRIIKSGTPLPKHGRLKDEDEIIKAIEERVEFLRNHDAIFRRLRKDIDILGSIPKIRCEVPTIIDADKAESEGER